jgi:thiol-disulfide isomerase/thioredoxin
VRPGGGASRLWPRLAAPACLLAAVALAACSEAPSGGGAEPVPAAEPMDFTLPDLAGQPVRLADFRGKTVILDFWATWCPPCVFQVPELNEFWERHASAGEVMVIGVAVDIEGAEVVSPWAEEEGVQYQLVIGSEDVARDFGAMGFPTLVILKPDGSIDSRHVGLIEADELEELVATARVSGET